MAREVGFAPVCDEHTRVLVLGSFPSVMSRREGFYYGNPQNRFWKMLSHCFSVPLPRTVDEKRALVLGLGVGLWDVVVSCEIEGSADASIRAEETADLYALLKTCSPVAVFCNGKKSFSVVKEKFPAILPITRLLPSTSPANPRYTEKAWEEAFAAVFCGNLHDFGKSIDRPAEKL